MKYYILDGNFMENRPQGPDFKKALDAHHQYFDEFVKSGEVLIAGPKPTGGGIIIIKCEDEEAAQKICAEDPFVTFGVQTYKITEFKMFTGQESIMEWFAQQ